MEQDTSNTLAKDSIGKQSSEFPKNAAEATISRVRGAGFKIVYDLPYRDTERIKMSIYDFPEGSSEYAGQYCQINPENNHQVLIFRDENDIKPTSSSSSVSLLNAVKARLKTVYIDKPTKLPLQIRADLDAYSDDTVRANLALRIGGKTGKSHFLQFVGPPSHDAPPPGPGSSSYAPPGQEQQGAPPNAPRATPAHSSSPDTSSPQFKSKWLWMERQFTSFRENFHRYLAQAHPSEDKFYQELESAVGAPRTSGDLNAFFKTDADEIHKTIQNSFQRNKEKVRRTLIENKNSIVPFLKIAVYHFQHPSTADPLLPGILLNSGPAPKWCIPLNFSSKIFSLFQNICPEAVDLANPQNPQPRSPSPSLSEHAGHTPQRSADTSPRMQPTRKRDGSDEDLRKSKHARVNSPSPPLTR